jgi:hypothetical protein
MQGGCGFLQQKEEGIVHWELNIMQSQETEHVHHMFAHDVVKLLPNQAQGDVQILLHDEEEGVVELLVEEAVHDAHEAQGVRVFIQELFHHANHDQHRQQNQYPHILRFQQPVEDLMCVHIRFITPVCTRPHSIPPPEPSTCKRTLLTAETHTATL